MQAIDQLGYRPNGAARALVQGQQPIVGVIAQDTTVYGRARMLDAIEDRAHEAGFVVAVAPLEPGDTTSLSRALEVLLAQPIVGVVVLDYNAYDARRLHARLGNIPVATVTNGADVGTDVAHVLIDDRAAARDLTEHLLSLGHRTVHHVSVPGVRGGMHARELGWREALDRAGLEPPPPVHTDWSIAAAREAGDELAKDAEVTAVLCSNDEMAFAVMRSMHEAGRRLPEDVSVVGIDDGPLAGMWVPSLTTYHLDWAWAGRAAFELLMDPVSGISRAGEPNSGLVVRESSAAPRS